MALVVDQLQLWTIGFRWAGKDPSGFRVWVPADVKDNFSTLLEAILKDQLDCMTLDMRKWDGKDPEAAPFHIRYWLDKINLGIHRQRFSRKLLRHAVIEREAFRDWCARRSIPLPEFWFPPGWTEYRYPGDDEEDSVVAPGDAAHAAPDTALRTNQKARVACQVIAANIWRAEPEKTIASMCKDDRLSLGGAGPYDETTVRRWVQEVAPAEVSAKRGRPKKKNSPEDE